MKKKLELRGKKLFSRGQVVIEYAMLIGLVLVAVSIIAVFAFDSTSSSSSMNKTGIALRVLSKSAEQVASLGPGTKIIAKIDLPDNVSGQLISKNSLVYHVKINDGNTSVIEETSVGITGELPIASGIVFVPIEVLENGLVRIGGGLKFVPEKFNVTVLPGSSDSNAMRLWNDTTTKMTGIIGTTIGDANRYFTINGLADSLDANAIDDFNLDFSIPSDEESGYYEGLIRADTTQKLFDEAIIQVFIPQVLTTLTVNTFADDNYDAVQTTFQQGSSVYYAVDANDQTGNPMDLTDLNAVFKDPNGIDRNTFNDLTTSFGRFASSYDLNCSAIAGLWRIDVNGKETAFKATSATFTVLNTDQSNKFGFDETGAGINNEDWKDFEISNLQNCGSITITGIKVIWTGMLAGTKLDRVKLNNTTKNFTDADSNAWASFSGISLNQSSSSTDNYLRFTKDVQENATIQIDFNFSDSTIHSTGTITVN